ncbi:MAG: SRPBCC family protein [Crocinitomicaceae bacterium]|nr:SRPBCC family protein [Crocinitomicaceae bacterium]
MNKFKKWGLRVLKVLGVLVALYLLVALFAPSTYEVERQKEMSASPEAIYSLISSFEGWDSWSPWLEKDPTIVNTLEGEDGTVGAKQGWTGDPELSGEGSITITELVENQKMAYDLNFEGMPIVTHGQITLTPTENTVNVTWNNKGEIGYLIRPLAMFMDMDKMMGPDLERGLSNIDSLATIKQKEMEQFTITEIDYPGGNFYGIRQQLNISEVDSALFAEAYGRLGMFCGTNQVEMTGMPVSIGFEWNEEDGTCDIMPAFPVAEVKLKGSEGITPYTIPPGKALVLDYYGPYEEMMAAYDQLDTYAEEHGLTYSIVIEEYVGDPGEHESMDDVLTRIYVILE